MKKREALKRRRGKWEEKIHLYLRGDFKPTLKFDVS